MKTNRKRILSVMLVIGVLATIMVMPVSVSAKYMGSSASALPTSGVIWAQDFEDEIWNGEKEINEIKSELGYYLLENVTTTSTEKHGRSLVLHFNDYSKDNGLTAYLTGSSSSPEVNDGIVKWSQDFYIPSDLDFGDATGNRMVSRLDIWGSSGYGRLAAIAVERGDDFGKIFFNTGTSNLNSTPLDVEGKEVKTFSLGEWYNLSIQFDYENTRIDYYLDEALVGSYTNSVLPFNFIYVTAVKNPDLAGTVKTEMYVDNLELAYAGENAPAEDNGCLLNYDFNDLEVTKSDYKINGDAASKFTDFYFAHNSGTTWETETGSMGYVIDTNTDVEEPIDKSLKFLAEAAWDNMTNYQLVFPFTDDSALTDGEATIEFKATLSDMVANGISFGLAEKGMDIETVAKANYATVVLTSLWKGTNEAKWCYGANGNVGAYVDGNPTLSLNQEHAFKIALDMDAKDYTVFCDGSEIFTQNLPSDLTNAGFNAFTVNISNPGKNNYTGGSYVLLDDLKVLKVVPPYTPVIKVGGTAVTNLSSAIDTEQTVTAEIAVASPTGAAWAALAGYDENGMVKLVSQNVAADETSVTIASNPGDFAGATYLKVFVLDGLTNLKPLIKAYEVKISE